MILVYLIHRRRRWPLNLLPPPPVPHLRKYVGECMGPKEPGHLFAFISRTCHPVMKCTRVGQVEVRINLQLNHVRDKSVPPALRSPFVRGTGNAVLSTNDVVLFQRPPSPTPLPYTFYFSPGVHFSPCGLPPALVTFQGCHSLAFRDARDSGSKSKP